MRLAHVERQASALRDAGEAIAVRLGTERGHFVDQLDVALASLDDEPPGLRAYRDRFLKRQERGLGGDPKEAAQVMDVVLAALVALRRARRRRARAAVFLIGLGAGRSPSAGFGARVGPAHRVRGEARDSRATVARQSTPPASGSERSPADGGRGRRLPEIAVTKPRSGGGGI